MTFYPNLVCADSRMTCMLLRPQIDLAQPICFFKTVEESLIVDTLSMFESLDEFSEEMLDGAYHIISRIRIGYVKKRTDQKDQKDVLPVQEGGEGKVCSTACHTQIEEYLDGQLEIYGAGADADAGADAGADASDEDVHGGQRIRATKHNTKHAFASSKKRRRANIKPKRSKKRKGSIKGRGARRTQKKRAGTARRHKGVSKRRKRTVRRRNL